MPHLSLLTGESLVSSWLSQLMKRLDQPFTEVAISSCVNMQLRPRVDSFPFRSWATGEKPLTLQKRFVPHSHHFELNLYRVRIRAASQHPTDSKS
jgi:hypothetical protein